MDMPTLSGIRGGNSIQVARATSLAPSAVAIVVSLVIALFVVWPKFSEVIRLRTDNEQLSQRSVKLSEKAQILDSLNQDDLESQLNVANQLLPSDKGVFTLIRTVEQAAGASGVLLDRVEVSPGSIQQDAKNAPNTAQTSSPQSSNNTSSKAGTLGVPKIELKIAVSSDYKSFLQFLNNLLGKARVVAISDLSISSASSGGSGQIRSSLLLDAYWQPTPTELSAIESPLSELTPSELKRLEAVQASSSAQTNTFVPSVPLGRTDLFAPF